MDNGNGIMPVMPVGGNGGDFGLGGAGLWLFAILALFGLGGNGGSLFGGGNNNAIQNDINRGFDNQNLQAQTRDILSAVTGGTAQTIAASTANATNAINAIKDGNASLIREFGNVETALTALSGKQQECCCSIKEMIAAEAANTNAMIAQNKYEAAMNLAGFEQRLMSKLDANTIAALQNRVNQLELANATSSVVRYPTSSSWAFNNNPFCGSGCGCGL